MARKRKSNTALWHQAVRPGHQERYEHFPAGHQERHYLNRDTHMPGVVLWPWLLALALSGTYQQAAPGLQEVYRWRQINLEYPSAAARAVAVASGDLVPENNLPLGLGVWQHRVFVTLPRWKEGVPVTLATVPRTGGGESPLLRPYPSWEWHDRRAGCQGLTSVFRLAVDPCGRLWVLDSGQVNVASDSPTQQCPPQLLVFDLSTDLLLWRYRLPADQVKEGSLFSNIAVDVRGGRCDDAHVYMADVWRYGLVVYRLRDNTSWRISHHLFYPEPSSCRYELHGVTFRWTDGVFGLCLSPDQGADADRLLYFHPMSSNKEYAVPTSILRNATAAKELPDAFVQLGESRYETRGQASSSAMDRSGVMFYNLVTRDSVGCWNSAQPRGFARDLQGVVANNSETLWFPNDLKVDEEERQSLWVLSNRLPTYIYSQLDPRDYNFRILTRFTDELVQGTVCDPMYMDVRPVQYLANKQGCPV